MSDYLNMLDKSERPYNYVMKYVDPRTKLEFKEKNERHGFMLFENTNGTFAVFTNFTNLSLQRRFKKKAENNELELDYIIEKAEDEINYKNATYFWMDEYKIENYTELDIDGIQKTVPRYEIHVFCYKGDEGRKGARRDYIKNT